MARIKPLQNRNALQLSLTSMSVLFLWSIEIFFLSSQNFSFNEILSSVMIFTTALLVYLEIWALLSRGYTIGILLTLRKASTPLNDQEIAKSYRAGEGLEWLIQHRFSSLFAAKLISKNGNEILLTPVLGNFVAQIYRIFIYIFSLKKTG